MNLSTVAATETGIPGGDAWVMERARLVIYQFLALATSKPHAKSWPRILDPDYLELVQAAVDIIRRDPRSQPESLAPGELPLEALDFALLKSLLQNPPGAEDPQAAGGSVQALCEEYDRVFGLLHSKECPPYETQYCPQTFSVFRSQALGDIAGYYRAFGLEPSSESPDRHDHVSLELEFMAWLNTKTLYAMEDGDPDNESLCRDAQVSFLEQHLAWWVTAFALALRIKADGIQDQRELGSAPRSFQGAIGVFLAAFISAERGFLGIAAPTTLVASGESSDSEGCEPTDCESCVAGIDTTLSND